MSGYSWTYQIDVRNPYLLRARAQSENKLQLDAQLESELSTSWSKRVRLTSWVNKIPQNLMAWGRRWSKKEQDSPDV